MTIKKLHSQKDQIYMNVIFKEQQPNRSVGGTERKGATLLPAVLVAVDGSPPSLGKRTDDVELRVGVTDVEVGSISNSCSSSSSNSSSGSSGGGGLVGLPCPGLAWSHPHKPVATHPTPF
uniref:Uncharacterized protein n=1 Tax=Vespula pensylvanica TaxID=30213 RepID=A0A834UAL3_VESPE|nr:hypothetical protein H0235_008239 [Vespula pensylvanica]